MNYYPHHLGDWAKKCGDLSMLEEGAYRRLVDWYYINEKPLPLSMPRIYKLARCDGEGDRPSAERAAVREILDRYFRAEADGFHNQRCDEVIASLDRHSDAKVTLDRHGDALGVTPAAIRQKRYIQRLGLMRSDISAAGVLIPANATASHIRKLWNGLETHQRDVTRDVIGDVSNDATVTDIPNTISQNEKDIGPSEGKPLAVETIDPHQAGAACKAMKRLGVSDVSPGHPLLHDLLRAGVTTQDLGMAAAEAVARGAGFAYALTVAKSRFEKGPARPLNGHQSDDQGVGRAWVPEALRKRSQPVLEPRTPDDPLTLDMAP
jgi:uncharacterized protein YdaU (DUF1376 family)